MCDISRFNRFRLIPAGGQVNNELVAVEYILLIVVVGLFFEAAFDVSIKNRLLLLRYKFSTFLRLIIKGFFPPLSDST